MLFATRSPRRFRCIAGVTAALFFYVTLFLSVNHNGSLGIANANAWTPPIPRGNKNLPGVFFLGFQRAGNYVSESASIRISEYYKTLLAMNSAYRLVTKPVKPVVPTKPVAVKKPLKQNKYLEKADKSVWSGKDLLEKRKWGAAGSKFATAVRYYEKHMGELEDMDKFVEAQLFLAVARFAQGYDDDGEEALAKVVVLRPDLVVDRRWRSPTFIKALDRLKQGLSRVPTGTITIRCMAPACTIYVDGVVKGVNVATVSIANSVIDAPSYHVGVVINPSIFAGSFTLSGWEVIAE